MVKTILSAAWADFRNNFAATLLWLAAWAVLIASLSLVLDRLLGPSNDGRLELIAGCLSIGVIGSIAVSWHRARLLDEPLSGYALFGGLRLAIERRTAGYILRSFLLSCAYAVPFLLIGAIVVLINILRQGSAAHAPFDATAPAPGLVLFAVVGLMILFIVAVVVVMRLSPWLPAYAVEDPRSVREIWAASEGYAFPLFGSLFCFGLAFVLFQLSVEGVMLGLFTLIPSADLQRALNLGVDQFFQLLGLLGCIGILTRVYDCMPRQALLPVDPPAA